MKDETIGILVTCAIGAILGVVVAKNTPQPTKPKNRLITCVNEFNGSSFSYNTNTSHNFVLGIGSPSTVTVTTTKGKVLSLSTAMNSMFKCREVKK